MQQPADDADFRGKVIGILDRWTNHPDVDRIWTKISRAATAGDQLPLGAMDFVWCVINIWILATEIKRVTDGSAALEAKLRSQADRAFKQDRVAEAAYKKSAAIKFRADRDRLLGRKQAEAHLQLFKAHCSELFALNCGKPLDDVVATLTEIVFDCGTVTIDSVRGARKNRDIQAPK